MMDLGPGGGHLFLCRQVEPIVPEVKGMEEGCNESQ